MIKRRLTESWQYVRNIRNRGTIITAVAVLLLSWLMGMSIARMNLNFPLLFSGLVIFFLIFFRKESLLYMAPIAFCVPNMGLDIPGPWAIAVQDAFVGTAFLAYLTRGIIRRTPLFPRSDPIIRPLLAFWGIAMISVVKTVSISPDSLLFIVKDLMRLTELIALYFCLADVIHTERHIRTFIRTLLIMAFPMGLISWYIYFTGSSFFYTILTMEPAYFFYKVQVLRMISIAGSTSFTGLYYAVIIALAWTFPEWRATQRLRLVRAALLALAISCLVMTFNRGAWVGVLFGLAVMMLFGKLSWRKSLLAVVFLAGGALLLTTHFFAQFDVESKVNLLVEVSRSSGRARFIRWISAINVILDQPFLGVGYNNYAYVYGRYSIEEGLLRLYGSPHNMYVDAITGLGFIGFGIFAYFLRNLWRMHAFILKKAATEELRNISLGLFLALTFFLGASGFDSFLFKPHHTSFLIFSLWAISSGIRGMTLSQTQAPDSLPADELR